MAKVKFLGAVAGVTGSCYLVTTATANVVLDCGLYQGRREEEAANSIPFSFEMDSIDAVVLSHAHLDHSGRIPMLISQGYRGSVYMTKPTEELIEVLLKDSAHLQERDAQWENKRRRRSGRELIEPLYDTEEVLAALTHCEGIDYLQRINIADGVDVKFHNAGHILGASIVELFISENGVEKRLVFTGDLGNSDAALLQDPTLLQDANIILMESTYGDRNHRSMAETLIEFEDMLEEASSNGGNILIPAFAVGRTQEIIFRLGELYQKGKLKHDAVYLDSPMAIAVTEIYHRYQDVYNAEDSALMQASLNQKSLHNFLPILKYSTTTEESMALNKISKGAIIIAGSGMCTGGRIRHHLKHNLWREESHVVIVGFQAQGTTGRELVDGAKKVKVAGEEIAVRAQIHTMGGFSAHAGQAQLIEWLNNFQNKETRVLLVHGEDDAKAVLQNELSKQGWQPTIPKLNEVVSF